MYALLLLVSCGQPDLAARYDDPGPVLDPVPVLVVVEPEPLSAADLLDNLPTPENDGVASPPPEDSDGEDDVAPALADPEVPEPPTVPPEPPETPKCGDGQSLVDGVCVVIPDTNENPEAEMQAESFVDVQEQVQEHQEQVRQIQEQVQETEDKLDEITEELHRRKREGKPLITAEERAALEEAVQEQVQEQTRD